MNVLLIIIASIAIIIGLGIIVDYMISAKLAVYEKYFNSLDDILNDLLSEIEKRLSHD